MSTTETMIYDLPLKRTCDEFRQIASDLRQSHLVCKTFGSNASLDYQLDAANEWDKRADVLERLTLECLTRQERD